MYFDIARDIAEEPRTRENVIGIAVLGSTARCDVLRRRAKDHAENIFNLKTL